MDEKELQELDNKLEKAKEEANKSKELSNFVKDEINTQYEKDKQEVSNSVGFKQLTKEITERSAKAILTEDMIKVLNAEQKNELALHILNCQKEQIEYRKKHEKKVILEDVKADVFNKKVEALKKKYGYLYDKDENGNILNFVPSKTYNKYKAFCNWWENTTDGFKKIVKGSLKVLFWSAIASLVIILGYKFFSWISSINIPKV